MVKKYILLIGLVAVCIGMNAMEQRQQRFAPSYRQYFRPNPSYYTGYRYIPSLGEGLQTKYYEWQQERRLRNNLQQAQLAYDKELKHNWELYKHYTSINPSRYSSKNGIIYREVNHQVDRLMQPHNERLRVTYLQQKEAQKDYEQFMEQKKLRE